jgi:hypothetical protein
MPSYTVTTPVNSISQLTTHMLKTLKEHGIELLGDIIKVDFLKIADGLSEDEKNKLYKIIYKANVAFKFTKSCELDNLPLISTKSKKTLKTSGYHHLRDFEGVYYPDIYELIGISAAKELLVMIRTADVEVRFEQPNWSEEQWKEFTSKIVELELTTWEDIAICVCSELNPPQVGTAVANQVKDKYLPREAMKHVFKWFYAQSGKCEVSGKRLWLEVDHIESKEEFIRSGRDVNEANALSNFQLLTKRENVIKRGSHRLGGLSFAQASAVLMYVLLRYKPKNIKSYSEMCRNHGLTMANIRFQEAWALAEWLSREGLYEVDR